MRYVVRSTSVYQQRSGDRTDGARRRSPTPFRAGGHSLSGADSLGDQEPAIGNPDSAMTRSDVTDTGRSYSVTRVSGHAAAIFELSNC